MSASNNNTNTGYERSDVKLGRIALWGIGTTVMLVVIVLFSFDYFEVTREEMVYDMVLKPESEKLIELRARETDELTTYALLDAEKGIYRIPIEQAMSLVAAEAKK